MEKQTIAIIHPSGKLRISEEEVKARMTQLSALNFDFIDLRPQHPSLDECTAGPALERACILSHALTMRKYPILWCAKGGVGTTELVPFLENLLPPLISDKTLVGFSDASFLGVYLALRYPNLRYIHGNGPLAIGNFFQTSSQLDINVLLDLLENKSVPEKVFPIEYFSEKHSIEKCTGPSIILNLSLAESLSAIHHIELPQDNILFLEELNEDIYRIVRKVDSLINSNLLKNTKFIVLGCFTGCKNAQNEDADLAFIARVLTKKTGIPVALLPIFGHDTCLRFPLVMNSLTTIDPQQKRITLTFEKRKDAHLATTFSPALYKKENPAKKLKVHFSGIGGTGMASCAGLFHKAGFVISGSDGPIYPPMDKVIADLGITPFVNFSAENIKKADPDIIVLANVLSRLGASLQSNEELEYVLQQNIPAMSFPSSLRKYFLNKSLNIVVAGTHGKTTTSSLVTHTLMGLEKNPSYLIGGSPVNFSSSFALNSPDLFVLEGDEYDSAFFDKGPKFLHYEPKIAIINNIEFDHADIYPNVEAIEDEFLRLACLTRDKQGFVIANLSDKRVVNVVERSKAKVIGFSTTKHPTIPCWYLKNYETNPSGIVVTCVSPDGIEHHFQTGIFGAHNALNLVATMAALHAFYLLELEQNPGQEKVFSVPLPQAYLTKIAASHKEFRGVKRRFELLGSQDDIFVFDDFAHHPTAIATTLEAFRSYIRTTERPGRLIACFDPRNATMRRRVLQEDLKKSFHEADVILIGKVAQDLRIKNEDTLNAEEVVHAYGTKAQHFQDNAAFIPYLLQNVRPGDTVVFMSSGSFDGLPKKFVLELQSKNKG